MLKSQRHEIILSTLQQKSSVTVSELMKLLNVTDATVRRDLTELDREKKLVKIHGGATTINSDHPIELSHKQKKVINVDKKEIIAEKAVKLIKEYDHIFLGPGTTIEQLTMKIDIPNLKVVTNSLSVFNILSRKKLEGLELFLVGGEYRKHTEAFVGELANIAISHLTFNKMFFSANGILDNKIMTATLTEGQTQATALDNSTEKYLLIDSTKFGKTDLYNFYNLNNITQLISNK